MTIEECFVEFIKDYNVIFKNTSFPIEYTIENKYGELILWFYDGRIVNVYFSSLITSSLFDNYINYSDKKEHVRNMLKNIIGI